MKYEVTDQEMKALMVIADKETRKEFGKTEEDALNYDAYSFRNGVLRGLLKAYSDRGAIVEQLEKQKS